MNIQYIQLLDDGKIQDDKIFFETLLKSDQFCGFAASSVPREQNFETSVRLFFNASFQMLVSLCSSSAVGIDV